MKDLLEISCGLDVHKDKIVACILSGPIGKTTVSEIREFTTLIPDMAALRDWIVSCNCHHVAMESTGIYWQPIYEILEDAYSGDITLLVVNARHMKNVPGKKTDMRDSEWIATLLRAGLLNGSFIPDKQIREFRYLNRYRKVSSVISLPRKTGSKNSFKVPVSVYPLLFQIYLVPPAETSFVI